MQLNANFLVDIQLRTYQTYKQIYIFVCILPSEKTAETRNIILVLQVK